MNATLTGIRTEGFRFVLCFLVLGMSLTLTGRAAEVRILMETEAGNIEFAVDPDRAPATVANFLRYIDAGRYDSGRFHRTVRTSPDNQPQSAVKIDVIQGAVNPQFKAQDFPPVPLERTGTTGLRHQDGTLSMARMEPDSATSDFFICIGDQPELDFGGKRNPDGQGFAAFGRVTAGMDVVRKIHRSPASASTTTTSVAAGNQRLDPAIRILRARRK
jgi:peptidyl-prolyl cis-trans isomerase A (cyclophilin A)